MLDATCLALNAINRDFYRQSAESFNDTRKRPWPGWARVVTQVARGRGDESESKPESEPAISVLDIGCGNGRFGVYAAREFGAGLTYCGIDASPELLSFARRALTKVSASLVEHDLVTAPLDAVLPAGAGQEHDVVALYGIMHHLPSRERRRALLAACGERLASGGVLALTSWQFGARERFTKKIVPWESAVARYGIDPAQLEAGDTLLSWGAGVERFRYCHFAAPSEAEEWATLPGFRLIDEYDADGQTGDLNHYLLLQRG